MLQDLESLLGCLRILEHVEVFGLSEIHNLKGFVVEIQGEAFEIHHVEMDYTTNLAGVGSETFLNNIH